MIPPTIGNRFFSQPRAQRGEIFKAPSSLSKSAGFCRIYARFSLGASPHSTLHTTVVYRCRLPSPCTLPSEHTAERAACAAQLIIAHQTSVHYTHGACRATRQGYGTRSATYAHVRELAGCKRGHPQRQCRLLSTAPRPRPWPRIETRATSRRRRPPAGAGHSRDPTRAGLRPWGLLCRCSPPRQRRCTPRKDDAPAPCTEVIGTRPNRSELAHGSWRVSRW